MTSVRNYFYAFLTLIVLTIVTVGVAFVDLGRFNATAALVIASAKAIVVAMIFMHLRESRGLPRAWCLFGLFWLLILIGLTMADVATRSG